MKQLFILILLCFSLDSLAQTDTTFTEDFSAYGDADDRKIKTYCTQKVLYMVPTKLISVGYEYQAPFGLESTDSKIGNITDVSQDVRNVRGLRLAFNAPVISRSNFILNLGLTYWNSAFSVNGGSNPFANLLEHKGLRTTGFNATIFKPFDNKHFVIVQASIDNNGNYRKLSEVSNKGTTLSGTAIYGWKRDDNFMWGVGLTRTYRAGEVLHIPVIMYNRTFNKNWGIESIFPARVNLRRNFGTTALLQFGYELEGNSFWMQGGGMIPDVALRRGELKPRITFEKQLAGFVWLSVQAGMRVNWRFDASAQPDSKRGEYVLQNNLGNPLYFNVSLNLVSP